MLDWVIAQRGAPTTIRCDNGPEFTSRHFLTWGEERQIRIIYIQPGRPMQNGYVESFNGRFRDECLNANWFATMNDARQKVESWRIDYNDDRPHSSLGSGRRPSLQRISGRRRHDRDLSSIGWGKGTEMK